MALPDNDFEERDPVEPSSINLNLVLVRPDEDFLLRFAGEGGHKELIQHLGVLRLPLLLRYVCPFGLDDLFQRHCAIILEEVFLLRFSFRIKVGVNVENTVHPAHFHGSVLNLAEELIESFTFT